MAALMKIGIYVCSKRKNYDQSGRRRFYFVTEYNSMLINEFV
jgi:hypothetical protein